MPVTDCEGWPYPTRSDLFQRSHICDLATAMDLSLKAAQDVADLLVSKPTSRVIRNATQAIVIATPTLITFDLATDDPYTMWNNLMVPGITDRVFVRPPHAGNWFVRATISSAAAKAAMTNYLIEIISVSIAGVTTVHSARSETGTMETGSGVVPVGDTISALVPLSSGEGVAIRFTWNGAASPYNVNAQLEMAFVSACDRGNLYYNDWEDGTTTGWTAVNATITNSNVWSAFGTRSLKLTPLGGFLQAIAVGPILTAPPHTLTLYGWYAGVVRTAGSVSTAIRHQLEYFDSTMTSLGTANIPITPLAINTTYRQPPGPYNIPNNTAFIQPSLIIDGTPAAIQFAYFDETTVARACGKGTDT